MDATDIETWRRRYLAAQLTGQRREALQVLDDAMAIGRTVQELQMQVVQEAQRELGALWELHQVSVAQEHMATAISQLALAHLFQKARGVLLLHKKVVLACVAGELHDFPARLAADVLELAGFRVCFLGADVPTQALVAHVAVEEPDLLCLSVTVVQNLDALRAAVAAVRGLPQARGRRRLPVMVGGHACVWSPAILQEIGADDTAADAVQLVRAARILVDA